MVGVFEQLTILLCPICIAFVIGLTIGWSWRPKWAIFNNGKSEFSESNSQSLNSSENEFSTSPTTGFDHSRGAIDEGNSNAVNEDDFVHLFKLVEVKDGGPNWIHIMELSTPTMAYKAWRRDSQIGPPQYRSSTIFENAAPEIVRDFFWDEEFRPNWDNLLRSSKTISECPITGTVVIQQIRKFPFFFKDREYIIGRRIWESGRSYYCVTKGVPCTSIPRKDKPRRVDLYYSSWCIRAVESPSGSGQLSACEVLLFHHEEMGISWELAKIAVRNGMPGLVKKIEPGLRAYQRQRDSGAPLSRAAFMANIYTKINTNCAETLGDRAEDTSSEAQEATEPQTLQGFNIPKLLIIGGAVVLACVLNQGLFGKAKRSGNVGKKLRPSA